MTDKLKIAIQKSGRLSKKSLELISDCGIYLTNGSGKLLDNASNFPLEVMYLRDDDIPQYVEDNVVDAGILGSDVVYERGKNVDIVKKLGFAKCKLKIGIRREDNWDGTSWLQGKKIATSYPNILNNYLAKNKISATVEQISGSVEIAPGIGLADCVCDIVSTGSTLITNGLKAVETVIDSEAVLIASPNLEDNKTNLLNRLVSRIVAVTKARENKYIIMNVPNASINEITLILPGIKSPTITPLGKEGWSSLHSVVSERDFWPVVDQLKSLGAEGILVLPIEKMVI